MGIQDSGLLSEVTFRTGRSGGKGGQHVNKVSTRVELLFHIPESVVLNEEQKEMLLKGARSYVTRSGMLVLSEEGSRSQAMNKRKVISRFLELVKKSLLKKKKRIPTKTTRAAKETRLESKKIQSEKKKQRSLKINP